jgi:hypothetical protein
MLLAAGLALGARHGLVEPAARTQRCDATPWLDTVCTLRTLTVQAFVDQRLALAALVLALLAVLTGRRWAAGSALAAGSAGLVLYSADIAAAALLLGALACVRPPASSGPAR